MTTPATARVLVTLGEEVSGPTADRQGALWKLSEPRRGLDANVVRLPPGTAVAEHSDDVLDVLLVVLDGDGHLGTPAGREPLTPHAVVWLPRTSRRSLVAGERGLVYLTAHPRRPGLSVTVAPPVEGGEPPCALDRVCAGCGRLTEEHGARFCSRCGQPLPD